MEKITVQSPAFFQGQGIPAKYTCKGSNVSPAISWKGIPKNAKYITLICDDPDAPSGDWVHWVVYNIPAKVSGLEEAVQAKAMLENGASQGINDFGRTGYGGPCPPSGEHRYYFRVYALEGALELAPENATKSSVLEAADGLTIGYGELMGTFRK